MKKILPFLSYIITACSPSPRPVIFDTDWWTDVDDVCALRTLLNAEQKKMVTLKGICLSAVDSLSVPSLSSFLNYEGCFNVFLGADKEAIDYSGNPLWHGVLAEEHPQQKYR